MTVPETAAPVPAEHPYEFPPPLPLRLAGHIGGRIIPEHPEWAYLAEPFADATLAILAEWDRSRVRVLPARHAAPPAPPEPVPAAPRPEPRIPAAARLAALPPPADTPAHAGDRRPLFRRRHAAPQPEQDQPGEDFAEPPEPTQRDHAAIWPRPVNGGQPAGKDGNPSVSGIAVGSREPAPPVTTTTDGPGLEGRARTAASAPGSLGADGAASPPSPGPSAFPAPSKSGTVPPPVPEPEQAATVSADDLDAGSEQAMTRFLDAHDEAERTEQMTAILPVPSEGEHQ